MLNHSIRVLLLYTGAPKKETIAKLLHNVNRECEAQCIRQVLWSGWYLVTVFWSLMYHCQRQVAGACLPYMCSHDLKTLRKNAVDIIRNLSWCVANLKGNLDLVLEELANGNETEQQNARQIKEKMQRYTLSDLQKNEQFNQKI